MCLKLRIARIDTFGRKCEQKVLIYLEALFLKHRLQHFVGRTRIGRRFENYHLAAPQIILYLAAGSQNVGHIRIFRFAKRGRHANDDHVTGIQFAKVGGCSQLAAIDTFLYIFACHIDDVRATGVYLTGFCIVDLKADCLKAF